MASGENEGSVKYSTGSKARKTGVRGANFSVHVVGGVHDDGKNVGAQNSECSELCSSLYYRVEIVASVELVVAVFAQSEILRHYAGFHFVQKLQRQAIQMLQFRPDHSDWNTTHYTQNFGLRHFFRHNVRRRPYVPENSRITLRFS